MMWTPWIDRDDPSGDGDAEYYDTASPNNTLPIRDACDGREGIVQVVTTDTNQTPEQVGQVVRYSQSNRGR
jgi:hypothetical protein